MSENTSKRMEGVAREFDIDKALDTKGFAEFLAAHSDAETFDMEDQNVAEKRFEVFNTKEGVKKDLKELYSGHIKKEMGIKLEVSDLSSIDIHLEKQAIENPDELLEMRSKLDQFRELPQQITQLERQLEQAAKSEELSANLAVLREDRENLKAGKKYLGKIRYVKLAWDTLKLSAKSLPLVGNKLFGMEVSDEYVEKTKGEGAKLAEAVEGQQAIQNKYGKKVDGTGLERDIANQIGSTEKVLAAVQEVEKLKALAQEMFTNVRKELIGGISGIAELTTAIQTKALAQFQELTKNGSVKALDQAQERFESLKSVTESTETGINPLGGIDEKVFQEQVDASLEKAASEEIMETVLRANMGTNALTKLEKALEPFLEREKIGSKEGDDARDFISNTLEEAAKKLGNTNEDKAKKLMIARILIKMKS